MSAVMALDLPGVLFCDKKQTWMKFMIVCPNKNAVPGVYIEAWGRSQSNDRS